MLSRVKSLVRKVIFPIAHPFILTNPYIAGKFLPLAGHSRGYIVPKLDTRPGSSKEDLPLPPQDLLQGYSPEEHLASGHSDMAAMLDTLTRAGAAPQELTRVLDFGCAAGRMLRFYP